MTLFSMLVNLVRLKVPQGGAKIVREPFSFVILPVEFDASKLVLAWASDNRIVTEEQLMAKNV